jgi:hypothetical protein
MSNNEFAEIPQPENYKETDHEEFETSRLKRQKKRINKPSKRNKRNENIPKIDLNKMTNQLILVPNAKPLGQSWIWGYFDQYEPAGQYKRIVKCLVQVQ